MLLILFRMYCPENLGEQLAPSQGTYQAQDVHRAEVYLSVIRKNDDGTKEVST
jgi:predicted Zn-dependent protease